MIILCTRATRFMHWIIIFKCVYRGACASDLKANNECITLLTLAGSLTLGIAHRLSASPLSSSNTAKKEMIPKRSPGKKNIWSVDPD
jgi:hypothetical protein